jgi:hypothetical protein
MTTIHRYQRVGVDTIISVPAGGPSDVQMARDGLYELVEIVEPLPLDESPEADIVDTTTGAADDVTADAEPAKAEKAKSGKGDLASLVE